MQTASVPVALRERLGEPGTTGLLDLLDTSRKEWTADVLTISSERFEHRLTAECNKVRLEMTNGFAALRTDMAQMEGRLRDEMHRGLSDVRVELIKWSFAFWAAQIVTLGGIIALLLRAK